MVFTIEFGAQLMDSAVHGLYAAKHVLHTSGPNSFNSILRWHTSHFMVIVILPTPSSIKLANKYNASDIVYKSVVQQLAAAVYGKEIKDCLGSAQQVLKKKLPHDGIQIQIPSCYYDKGGEYARYLEKIILHCLRVKVQVSVIYT